MMNDACCELTIPGVLRAAINLGNIFLVTGKDEHGAPTGVAPDVATLLAQHLGTRIQLIPYPFPGEIADAMPDDPWDVALIGNEAERAEHIAFSPAYVEIEATYMLPASSPFGCFAEVDQPGVRIAIPNRAAYDLYLSRTLKHAQLHRAPGLPKALALFRDQQMDALAGLAPALRRSLPKVPGARVLPGHFTTIQQAIGTKHRNAGLQIAIATFIDKIIADGTVSALLRKYGVADDLAVPGTKG